ncbi:hypothetical protein BB347_04765 [Natronorubrum daqingense]|uniref:Uncharacterized protein n=1 Tax=Natronorubrum daqingense TaxID=588898 RepID=A0A1P8RBN5_9EURY|nr:hypothetical protein BB347_04765 [Natronorubrum daqingense]
MTPKMVFTLAKLSKGDTQLSSSHLFPNGIYQLQYQFIFQSKFTLVIKTIKRSEHYFPQKIG